jgi:hypothetical protein
MKGAKTLRDKDELIYDLIFSDNVEYEIHIDQYIEDIYKYDYFIDDIKDILYKSKVKIMVTSVIVDVDSVVWNLKIKK